MRFLSPIIALLALLTMLACSENHETTTTQAGSRVSSDNVFSDQVKALEKAEQLEGQMMEAFHKRDASINSQ